MSRFLHRLALPLFLFLITAALPILAQVTQPNSTESEGVDSQPRSRPGIRMVPWRDATAPVGKAAPAGAHLTYFGGPVISNAHVIEVLYGSGSFLPQVSTTATPSIGSFFGDLLGTNSGYVNLLSQYDTPASGGTNQTIGNGTFDGLFQIVPSAANSGSRIDDTQIQAELLAQINAGHLPTPQLDAAGHVNTLYMIYFPPGVSITQGGSSSCVNGGFCAYHGTTSNTLGSKNVLYGVLPDMQAGSGCDLGCGSSTVFGNYTSVTSHELTEAITDADVGIATTFSAPLAWFDMTNGEIGDICNAQQGSYTANGTTYTIQLEFSNAANNCVLPPPPSTPNFSIAASPASLTVKQGNSASSTITVADSGGFAGTVGLSVSGLPAGATASFSPASVGAGTSTLSITTSSSTPTGTFALTVTGTSGSLTHTTTVTLVVTSAVASDFTIAVSPASLNVTRGTSGSYTVTITSVNGFAGAVNLSVTGLGSRVTGSFNPTSVTGSGHSTLRVTVSSRATRGARTLTITGTSGSLVHSAKATLNVQ
ncbi:MAG TPA: hypothetical protein VKZ53_06055 [Candidatus Angelobacter sp.]|nr:hypothetical protein [Candidatus Angelobacter sp.]